MKIIQFVYGIVCYLVFLASFLYAIGFVGNFGVQKSIDSGPAAGLGWALAIDLALLAAFAIQHSVMARPAFKRWWTRFVPWSIERSTYVLLASLLLLLLFWQWRPLTASVWNITQPTARVALQGLFWLGWLLVLYSTFLINHFDLLGLRQVSLNLRGQAYTHVPFQQTGLYRYLRHPIMLGFLIAFWATPDMSFGHLLFSLATSAYILLGIRLEERDTARVLGDSYRRYRQRVAMLLPWPRPRSHDPD